VRQVLLNHQLGLYVLQGRRRRCQRIEPSNLGHPAVQAVEGVMKDRPMAMVKLEKHQLVDVVVGSSR
jgi:hypothetical protein